MILLLKQNNQSKCCKQNIRHTNNSSRFIMLISFCIHTKNFLIYFIKYNQYNIKLQNLFMEEKDQETGFVEDFELLNKKFNQHSEKCEYELALPFIQQIVEILKKNNNNIDDAKVFEQYCVKLTQILNAVGMIALENNDQENCYKFLKRAEGMGIKNLKVQATTFNNLGCYYRKIKKYSTSLGYLRKSLALELKLTNHTNLPDTYINICAVLSSLGEHEQAIVNAMMSIILLQHGIIDTLMTRFKSQTQKQNLIKSQKLSILSLAHYNLGVEFQHLNKMEESTRFYDKAIMITQSYNSKNIRLLSNLERVKHKIQLDLKEKMSEERLSKRRHIENIKTEVERDQFYKNLHEQIRKERSFYLHGLKSNNQSRMQRYSPNSSQNQDFGTTHHHLLRSSYKREKLFKINHSKHKIKEFFT